MHFATLHSKGSSWTNTLLEIPYGIEIVSTVNNTTRDANLHFVQRRFNPKPRPIKYDSRHWGGHWKVVGSTSDEESDEFDDDDESEEDYVSQ